MISLSRTNPLVSSFWSKYSHAMEWLNYHHLLYFWQVANEGSIVKASEKLHLTPQTISAQIKSLEESLGHKLFMRQGRNLTLTPDGEEVLQYADDILYSTYDS